MSYLDVLFLPLDFAAGISPGEGSEMNVLTVARDGKNRPLLRGTSIAGVLRSAYASNLHEQNLASSDIEKETERWFGGAAGGDTKEGTSSRVLVDDAVLELGESDVSTSTHHLRNRHTGVVTDKGLFAMESCPPGTKAVLAIWIRSDDSIADQDREAFINTMTCQLGKGLIFGGRNARGVGVAALATDQGQRRTYALNQVDDYASYLDQSRQWRSKRAIPQDAEPISIEQDKRTDQLQVEVTFRIPRGQDILIAEGDTASPQRVTNAKGEDAWKLPGSSLRGTLKSWMTRLAALDGKSVEDSVAGFKKFRAEEDDDSAYPDLKNMTNNNCPINNLFGTVKQEGRIHVPSAFSKVQPDQNESQLRMHVAIDRITGGAAEGLLFQNHVLTSGAGDKPPRFKHLIRIDTPTADDCNWLAKSLLAIHHGVVRIGSSKSSGRLELESVPTATGANSDLFTNVFPKQLGQEN